MFDDSNLIEGADGRRRCLWVGTDPLYQRYHDEEWGVPRSDDRDLFEKLCLEGFQAGLSWITILRKRPAFRAAFANFDMDAVTRFDDGDVQRLLGDASIVRHRGKIEAAINNARCALDIREDLGSLAALLWRFAPLVVEGEPTFTRETMPAQTPASEALSKELRRRGFRFIGPTTSYALMQSMGMVNDHLDGCWRRAEVETLRRAFERPG